MSLGDDSNNDIKNMFANAILQFQLEKGLSQLQTAQLFGLSLKNSQKEFSYRIVL